MVSNRLQFSNRDEAHRSQPSMDEYAGSGRAITSPWAGGSPLRRLPSWYNRPGSVG